MSKLAKLTGYHFTILTRSGKTLLLLAIWFLYLFSTYRNVQSNHVTSFVVSAVVLFYIMMILTMIYYDLEDESARNIMALNSKNMFAYHFSDLLALWLYGGCLSIIGVVFPLLFDKFVKNIFEKSISVNDIIIGIYIHILFMLLGVSIGAVFHPRIVKNRLFTVMITIVLAIAAITKQGIIKDKPFLVAIMWVVPPVSEVIKLFSQKLYFGKIDVIKASGYVLIYAVVCMIIHLFVLKKEKF